MIAALELARAVPLIPVCAFSIACQILAIVYFVEKLKAVELYGARTLKDWQGKDRAERRERAAWGLAIDLSLYLLAVEIVLTFVALTR